MENLILIVVLLAVTGFAAWYVVKAKKKGKKCIGCPDSTCSHTCGSCTCNCQGNNG